MSTQTAHAVHWLEWGPHVFEQARREDKLILLDSGATWCHWCHVMDRVTYDDPDLADLINARFVPVRIDRDRRPDVDTRMQRQPALAGGNAGGWPLTVVLTPDGSVLYKATFMPPRSDPHYGAPAGLIDVLTQLDIYWRSHRDEVDSAANTLLTSAVEGARQAFHAPGELSEHAVAEVAEGVKDAYDQQNAGFGPAPKFYQVAAIELMLARAWRGDLRAREMAARTLEVIAAGGVHDHVGGGFHRYSVDERWHVPHFEKLAADNAALACAYLHASSLLARRDFEKVARTTLRWIGATLGDAATGAFGASQDADVGLDDDGDYFTWTLHEVRQATAAEPHYADVLIAHFGMGQMGHMHQRPGRNVLHAAKAAQEVARLLNMTPHDAAVAIDCGREMLVDARARRPAPAVDRTVLADVNAMIAEALLTAADTLGEDEYEAAALRAIDYVLTNLRDSRGVFAHYAQDGQLRAVGMLSDQAWMLKALVHAAVRSGRQVYVGAARQAADYVLAELAQPDGALGPGPAGGPGDMESPATWDDGSTASAASVFCAALSRLGQLVGERRYVEAAGAMLGSFAGGAMRRWGVFLAGYAMAVDEHIHQRTVLVAGPGQTESVRTMLEVARRTFVPGGLVALADPRLSVLPLAHELRLGESPQAAAYVCDAGRCLAPAHCRDELLARLREAAE